jgi:hypothetical protein
MLAGGTPFEAVDTVANPDEDVDVVGVLARLIEHRLLRQAVLANREPRFAMLKKIREYGLERFAGGLRTDSPMRWAVLQTPIALP